MSEGCRQCTIYKTSYKLLKKNIKTSKKIQDMMSTGINVIPFRDPYKKSYSICPYCKGEDVLRAWNVK